MKWLTRVTKIIAYVAKCAEAVSKAADVLHDNWPSDSPFNSGNGLEKKEGLVKNIPEQRV